MMKSSEFSGLTAEARRIFEEGMERETLSVAELQERLTRDFSPQDKIEFFRRRRDVFKEIRK